MKPGLVVLIQHFPNLLAFKIVPCLTNCKSKSIVNAMLAKQPSLFESDDLALEINLRLFHNKKKKTLMLST